MIKKRSNRIESIKIWMAQRKNTISAVYLLLFPALLFLFLEILNITIRDDGYSYILFNMPAFIISCVFLYVAALFIFMISGRIFATGMFISIALFAFYVVNFYRHVMTGNILVPADFNLVTHMPSVRSFSALPVRPRPYIIAFCVVALNLPLKFISPGIRVSAKTRVFGTTVAGAVVFFIFFTTFSRVNILPVFGIDIFTREGINQLYESDGALMGFYTLLFSEPSDAPADYGRGYINRIVSNVQNSAGVYAEADDIKPDVIVIMSESFIDPTRLPNVEYSEDPVPNFHRISKNETSGYVVVPTFGGMTCNTEYEFLTGNAMKFTGYGDTPYYKGEMYIDSVSGRTLAAMFKENGYKTVGLHTNTVTFYDRVLHYPKLGFDEFIGEEMMPDAKYKGALPNQNLISDEYFTDTLINIMETTEEPLFLYGISMQNHSAYLPDKYESTSITAESEFLDDDDIAYLETYVEGAHDADIELGRLYEYVMSQSNPTIVVFFGDHLPVITHGSGVFAELGYISENELTDLDIEDTYALYTTPYVAFSNYKNLGETWGNISTYFLSALTANVAGIKKNLYYVFLMQAYERFHALTDKMYINMEGKVSEAPSRADEDIIEMFRALQYDRTFGQNYTGDRLSALVENN